MQKIFTLDQSETFLKNYLPIAKSKLTKTLQEAINFSKKTKFPLVLKLISPKAIHKTEIKGIRIINNQKELEKNYNDLIKISKTKKLELKGILIQEFVKGKELIIGIKNDPTFKHVIMLGLGGIFVEILKDTSFRVCPITNKDAISMINDLKGKQILFGVRGEKPINLEILKKILVKTSKIPLKYKKIQELDINPLIISQKEAKIVDARLVFS